MQNLNSVKDAGQECVANLCNPLKKISRKQFFTTVQLFIDQPHIVNKKICGFHLHWLGICHQNIAIEEVLQNINCKINRDIHKTDTIEVIITLLTKNSFENIAPGCEKRDRISWEKNVNLIDKIFVIVREIIPKHISSNLNPLEVVVIDGNRNCVHFIEEKRLQKLLPEFNFTFSLIADSIQLTTWKDVPENSPGLRWLKGKVLPRLLKWASQMEKELQVTNSLQLVDIQEYNKTYQRLKSKYGTILIESWTESTDPLKYIHEDIAIASYLLVLWKEERLKKQFTQLQSFMDLGCGNGLLVYLLASEGHTGLGIDVRKRKIWANFPDFVQLKESAIEPCDEHLYPQYDWLIGNHSDELTPWLPVIAAKSSMRTRFFLIPCCSYDFQNKFQRKCSDRSQYSEYIDYIEYLSNVCGFRVFKDKLRIPSTKRICLVGQERTYDENNWRKVIDGIDYFIKNRCSMETCDKEILRKKKSDENFWCDNFTARQMVERVKNCTQIGDDIRDNLVKDIAFLLLKQENFIKIYKESQEMLWNKGGEISMLNLVHIMKSRLHNLKKECGGLQTLIRNHRFVFLLSNGQISLRVPQTILEKTVAKDLVKTKYCWFHYNHPQGCTLVERECSYMH